ncbi:hypothetical protein [Rhizobium sp. S163]|uniref:hypothetical protein n=1 Tax=Rhizobium sp. S163 TaxID=3055039 RepID=UPI0025A95595|nr:hypothetical protein [Rhizobium sp. S163]MDM9647814.1 hypothetical protein [Rhizobium sp. S163]
MRIGGRVFPYIAGGGIALEWLPFADDGAAGMAENTPSPDWRLGEVVQLGGARHSGAIFSVYSLKMAIKNNQ